MDLGYKEVDEVVAYLTSKGYRAKRSTMKLNRLSFAAVVVEGVSPNEEYDLMAAIKRNTGMIPATNRVYKALTKKGEPALRFVPTRQQ